MAGDVATGDGASLPWRGLDRLSVRFDRDAAAVSAADLRVVRPDRSVHTATHFAYDAAGRTATWTLARPMASGDVRVELVLPSGATWARDLRVLPGDVDRNDAVDALDVAEVKRRLASYAAGGGRYIPFADVTGDGRINALDLAAVKAGLAVQLPAPQAAAPAALLRSSVTRELFGDTTVTE